jgi:hypothetical protein
MFQQNKSWWIIAVRLMATKTRSGPMRVASRCRPPNISSDQAEDVVTNSLTLAVVCYCVACQGCVPLCSGPICTGCVYLSIRGTMALRSDPVWDIGTYLGTVARSPKLAYLRYLLEFYLLAIIHIDNLLCNETKIPLLSSVNSIVYLPAEKQLPRCDSFPRHASCLNAEQSETKPQRREGIDISKARNLLAFSHSRDRGYDRSHLGALRGAHGLCSWLPQPCATYLSCVALRALYSQNDRPPYITSSAGPPSRPAEDLLTPNVTSDTRMCDVKHTAPQRIQWNVNNINSRFTVAINNCLVVLQVAFNCPQLARLKIDLLTEHIQSSNIAKTFDMTIPSFRSLTADRYYLEAFRSCLPSFDAAKHNASNNALPLHLFEWAKGQKASESAGLKTIAELAKGNQSTIRVM